MKNRLYYIDVIKVLGIYLVILGHLPLTNIIFTKFIFSFHMPLFFFCSGYLFRKNSNIYSDIKKNIHRLLLVMIPYFILGVLFGIFQDVFVYKKQFDLQNNIVEPIHSFVLGKSSIGWMWFLWALFWMRLVYNFYSINVKTSLKRSLALLITIIGGFILYYSGLRFNDYQCSAFIFSFPFFCFGCLTKKIVDKSNYVKYSSSIICLCLVIYLVIFNFSGRINMNALNCGTNYGTFLSIGSVALIGILLTLMKIKIPARLVAPIVTISNGTLVILGFHGMLIQFFKIVYKKVFHILLPPPYMDLLSGMCIGILIILILYFPIKYILKSENKFVRLLAGK